MAQPRGVQERIRVGRLEGEVEQQRQRNHGQALDEVEAPLAQDTGLALAVLHLRRAGQDVRGDGGHEHAQRRGVDADAHLAEGPDLRRGDDAVDDRRQHRQGGRGDHEPGLAAHHALAQQQIDGAKKQEGKHSEGRQGDGNPAPGQIAQHRGIRAHEHGVAAGLAAGVLGPDAGHDGAGDGVHLAVEVGDEVVGRNPGKDHARQARTPLAGSASCAETPRPPRAGQILTEACGPKHRSHARMNPVLARRRFSRFA
jgi:hypothetical protein